MFTIFVDVAVLPKFRKMRGAGKTYNICMEARKRIDKMGFQSMHSDVIVKDLPDHEMGAATKHHIELNVNHLDNERMVDTLVHEWAHRYFFNNRKSFKFAVQKMYKMLKGYMDETHPPIQKDKLRYSLDDIHDMYQNRTASEYYFIQRYIQRVINSTIKNLGKYVKNVNNPAAPPHFKKYLIDMYKIILPNHGKDNTVLPKEESVFGEYVQKVFQILQWKKEYNEPVNIEQDFLLDFLGFVIYRMMDEKEDANEDIYKHTYGGFIPTDRVDKMNELVRWVDAYGMVNEDEMWATGVEYFFDLPEDHRKRILKMMQS